MDVLILLLVLRLELFDGPVFLRLYLSDLHLAPPLHVLSQTRTLHLVLLLDLARNSLVLFSRLRRQRIEVLFESVTVLSLAHLLLLLLDFERTQVLLQLALVNAVLIFAVLELDLRGLLHHRLLIQVLEHQMLQALLPDLDRDRVLLLQVLMLTVLVTELSLLVFELFLGDEPEIIDSETLIVILSSSDLFLFDHTLDRTGLVSHGLLVLLVVVVIDGVGSRESLLLRRLFLSSTGSLCFCFSRHSLVQI